MKKMLLAALFSTFAVTAFAQDATSTCQTQASDKKLAGAALKSFMTKCQRDATTTCSSQASEKKLAGAAKSSFTKKCVRDAVGT
jgi:Ni/Co efflux regulator RcnB